MFLMGEGLRNRVGAQGQPSRGHKLPAKQVWGWWTPSMPWCSWVERGLTPRCFPGTKPPGAPMGAVTPAQPPSCCQALCPELVIAGAGQHSPLPPGLSLSPPLYPLPSTHQPPCKKQFGVSQGCPILPGPLLLFPCIFLPSPDGFCLLTQDLCSSHQVHPAKLPAQAGHPTESMVKSLGGFGHQGSPPAF